MYVCVINKYIQMTIFIQIPFILKDILFLFTLYLVNTTDDINKSTHGLPLLVLSSQASALLFRYFNIRDALQCVYSVGQSSH